MIKTLPGFYKPERADEIFMVSYEQLMAEALQWRKIHSLKPAASDKVKIGLMLIDAQNTFCLSSGQLFVAGRSGDGAVQDTRRIAEFIYRNMDVLTRLYLTMDTHTAFMIFHRSFWIDKDGNHPAPATIISAKDVENDIWKVNPQVAWSVFGKPSGHVSLQAYALHYVRELERLGRYPLMIWPHHGMLGGIDHAIVSLIFEATVFHTFARSSQTGYEIKGADPRTENYSVLGPEVTTFPNGASFISRNTDFIEKLLAFDAVIIAGQAKSHCVAWTIADFLEDITKIDMDLAKKVFLLEDCTSNVVIPGVDFTDAGDKAFADFAKAGMNLVKSTDPIETWPGIGALLK